MIQEIQPKQFHNQYIECEPDAKDSVLFFQKNQILAHYEDGVISIPKYKDYDKDHYDFYYLFAIDEKKYFLALEQLKENRKLTHQHIIDGSVAPLLHNKEYYTFQPVNIFRGGKPKDKAFALITAYHLNNWYRDNRICGRCGKPLMHDHKERAMHCECCNNMIYPKICPAVIVAVVDHDKLLLTKYAGRSYTNYALIAGFAEIGETIEQTVEREVMEEVGLKVKNIRYYKSQPWALSGTLLMGFFCELDGDNTIVLQEEELAEGEWVTADQMTMNADDISLTNEMMMKFKNEH